MANIRPTPSGKFELTITSKLLPRRLWFTFDSQAEAEAYGAQVRKWLAAGIVPAELLQAAQPAPAAPVLLGPMLRAWLATGQPSAADQEVLGLLWRELSGLPLSGITYTWAEGWVRDMKLKANLAPGTVRKRVQAVSRMLDWHLRRTPDVMLGNPLRLLPRGYSVYTALDRQQVVALGGQAKEDATRERRLLLEEEARVRAALAGTKRPDRERALQPSADFTLLFELLLGTGLRLREAYRLQVGQVDMRTRTLRAQETKTRHGAVRYRAVPLVPALASAIEQHLATRPGAGAGDLLMPSLWDGEASSLRAATNRLSARFAALFAYANVADITEHDLRHEATCRWYELRRPDGAWMFRSEEICRIMGWAPNSAMPQRYASFRAEDLAARLYVVSDQAPRAA